MTAQCVTVPELQPEPNISNGDQSNLGTNLDQASLPPEKPELMQKNFSHVQNLVTESDLPRGIPNYSKPVTISGRGAVPTFTNLSGNLAGASLLPNRPPEPPTFILDSTEQEVNVMPIANQACELDNAFPSFETKNEKNYSRLIGYCPPLQTQHTVPTQSQLYSSRNLALERNTPATWKQQRCQSSTIQSIQQQFGAGVIPNATTIPPNPPGLALNDSNESICAYIERIEGEVVERSYSPPIDDLDHHKFKRNEAILDDDAANLASTSLTNTHHSLVDKYAGFNGSSRQKLDPNIRPSNIFTRLHQARHKAWETQDVDLDEPTFFWRPNYLM